MDFCSFSEVLLRLAVGDQPISPFRFLLVEFGDVWADGLEF